MSAPSYSWEKEIDGVTYKISNDKSLLDLTLFNKAFAGDDVYWTGPMPENAIQLMVDNSCVLGLYIVTSKRMEANRNITRNTIQSHEQIGFGRLITDYSTVAYITDVWCAAEHQGKGLGKWMIAAMKEIIHSFPSLRRAVLLTQAKGKGPKFYEQGLGMRMADPSKDRYGFMEYVPE